jgi:hypothetical protein
MLSKPHDAGLSDCRQNRVVFIMTQARRHRGNAHRSIRSYMYEHGASPSRVPARLRRECMFSALLACRILARRQAITGITPAIGDVDFVDKPAPRVGASCISFRSRVNSVNQSSRSSLSGSPRSSSTLSAAGRSTLKMRRLLRRPNLFCKLRSAASCASARTKARYSSSGSMSRHSTCCLTSTLVD